MACNYNQNSICFDASKKCSYWHTLSTIHQSKNMKVRIRPLLLLAFCALLACTPAWAQEPEDDDEDYSAYDDAGTSAVKYATQKVRMLSPTKLISVGYEFQMPFRADFIPQDASGKKQEGPTEPSQIKYMGGLRWMANFPVISTNKMIINLGANYYESQIRFETARENQTEVMHALGRGLRTGGVNATLFKPLDEHRFIIGALQTDWNSNLNWGNFSDNFPMPTLTVGTLYGWKKNENFMWALGATQTWRGGEKLYLPLLLLNKTYSDRWGIEILAPARAHVRYNFSTGSLLMAGYEIEGNSYQLRGNFISPTGTPLNALEIRRSELKPRIVFEQRLVGFIWLSAQVGWRLNYKFHMSEERGSSRGVFVYRAELGNPLYAAVSINLVSP
jgi:hypothetical protein